MFSSLPARLPAHQHESVGETLLCLPIRCALFARGARSGVSCCCRRRQWQSVSACGAVTDPRFVVLEPARPREAAAGDVARRRDPCARSSERWAQSHSALISGIRAWNMISCKNKTATAPRTKGVPGPVLPVLQVVLAAVPGPSVVAHLVVLQPGESRIQRSSGQQSGFPRAVCFAGSHHTARKFRHSIFVAQSLGVGHLPLQLQASRGRTPPRRGAATPGGTSPQPPRLTATAQLRAGTSGRTQSPPPPARGACGDPARTQSQASLFTTASAGKGSHTTTTSHCGCCARACRSYTLTCCGFASTAARSVASHASTVWRRQRTNTRNQLRQWARRASFSATHVKHSS